MCVCVSCEYAHYSINPRRVHELTILPKYIRYSFSMVVYIMQTLVDGGGRILDSVVGVTLSLLLPSLSFFTSGRLRYHIFLSYLEIRNSLKATSSFLLGSLSCRGFHRPIHTACASYGGERGGWVCKIPYRETYYCLSRTIISKQVSEKTMELGSCLYTTRTGTICGGTSHNGYTLQIKHTSLERTSVLAP